MKILKSFYAFVLLMLSLSMFQSHFSLASTFNLSSSPVKIDGDSNNAKAGYNIVKLGDIDGDGFLDFAITSMDTDNRGRVGIFFGRPSTASWPAYLTIDRADVLLTGEAPGDRFGEYISGSGDINGDHIKDMAIAAPLNSEGGYHAGKVYVIFGRSRSFWSMASGPVNRIADQMLLGEHADDQLGPVTLCGDFNGDGSSDLTVSAPGYFDASFIGGVLPAVSHMGKIYLLFGNAHPLRTSDVISRQADLTYNPAPADFHLSGYAPDGNHGLYAAGFAPELLFGKTIAYVGDLNADGYDDLVVGTPCYSYFWRDGIGDWGRPFFGKIMIFPGNNRNELIPRAMIGGDSYDLNPGVVLNPAWVSLTWDYANGRRPAGERPRPYFYTLGTSSLAGAFGEVIVPAGDVDHDGFADFWVSSGIQTIITLIQGNRDIRSLNITHFFNQSVNCYNVSLSSGDVNGDGQPDLLVGNANESSLAPASYEGTIYLLNGRSDWSTVYNVETGYDTKFISEAAGDNAGYSTAIIGDINGDGREDIAIGAYGHDTAFGDDAGRAYLIFGRDFSDSSSLLHFINIIYYRPLIFPDDIDPRPWPVMNLKTPIVDNLKKNEVSFQEVIRETTQEKK